MPGPRGVRNKERGESEVGDGKREYWGGLGERTPERGKKGAARLLEVEVEVEAAEVE